MIHLLSRYPEEGIIEMTEAQYEARKRIPTAEEVEDARTVIRQAAQRALVAEAQAARAATGVSVLAGEFVQPACQKQCSVCPKRRKARFFGSPKTRPAIATLFALSVVRD